MSLGKAIQELRWAKQTNNRMGIVLARIRIQDYMRQGINMSLRDKAALKRVVKAELASVKHIPQVHLVK